MPILPLTARTVATLRAPSDKPRIEYFDAEVAGLTLRITSDGVKTWSLVYRHHGRKRRLTLGRFPDIGLAKARLRATEERGRIAGGSDPAADKQDERSTFGDTVGALFDAYKKATEKKRSWSEQRRIFENEVLPAWRHLRVQDIRRRDIRALVDRKAETAPVMANRMLSRISRLFSFAVERDWIDANPAFRIHKPGEEKSRDRVLSRDELRELWTALHETEAKNGEGKRLPRLSTTLNDAFIVMLLTAQRSGEVCGIALAGRLHGQRLVDDPGGSLEEPGSASSAAGGLGHPAPLISAKWYQCDTIRWKEVRGMANILVRNLDDAVLRQLKSAAKSHRRSLQAEIHEVLRNASTRRLAETRRLSAQWLKRLAGSVHTDSAALIREDRETR